MTEMHPQLYCDGLCAEPEAIFNCIKWKAYTIPPMFAPSILVF